MVKELNTVSIGGMSGGWSVKASCGVVLCGIGQPVQPVELQEVVRNADEVPFCGNFFKTSEGEAVEAAKLFDLSEHGFNDMLSLCVGASTLDCT